MSLVEGFIYLDGFGPSTRPYEVPREALEDALLYLDANGFHQHDGVAVFHPDTTVRQALNQLYDRPPKHEGEVIVGPLANSALRGVGIYRPVEASK